MIQCVTQIKKQMMKKLKMMLPIHLFFLLLSAYGQELKIVEQEGKYLPIIENGDVVMQQPVDGLWSIATDWQGDWPSDWHHAMATEMKESGPWKILRGTLELPQGEWVLQDAYRPEGNRIKCVRRFEWKGQEALEKATLSVRWKVDASNTQAFLPNILYYGNPSGEKNGKDKVPVFHGKNGEMAIFEEHRYTMPFASLEWNNGSGFKGAALHTRPSMIYGGNVYDQWWSLGVKANEEDTELLLYSGPVTYNDQKSVAKALQWKALPYKDTYTRIAPGTIIEKTFYIEPFPVSEKGSGFQRPMYTSVDIHRPFYVDDFPSYQEIIEDKYRFAKSRWIEGENYAGFNMYPEHERPRIVLGWAGQSEALVYGLQPLAKKLGEEAKIMDMVQRAFDHIVTSPVTKKGFPVRYEVEKDEWHSPDPVSEGQAMNSIAMAIKTARNNPKLKTKAWEIFLEKASKVHAKRILDSSWNPVNTAEAFYIAPLLIAAELFGDEDFSKAALKASDYYAKRHLDMEEPYWGGTLDATCEDKEGAWGAFQGFLATYEFTQDNKYLKYAQHAGDVVLSYTVVWDIPLPAGRLADNYLKTRGWTGVSPQNQHLDVYGVLETPALYKLGMYTNNEVLKKLAILMYRSCGQMIDPFGSQGEQLQHTNFAQHGDMSNVYKLRGGYSESWSVFWIAAHFLHAAAQFEEMGVKL